MIKFKVELTFACPLSTDCSREEKKDCGEKMKVDFELEQDWTIRQPCGEEAKLDDVLDALVDRFKCWSKEKKE